MFAAKYLRRAREGDGMRLVKHLLEGKGSAIFSIEPNKPVLEAMGTTSNRR